MSTGSQGEPMAALSRMANGDHPVVVGEGDTVILASSLIPGNENAVFRIINGLLKLGADVIHKGNAKVHVSGHAAAGELLYCYNILEPLNAMPVHGETRHLIANGKIAEESGVPEASILLADNGTVIDLRDHQADVVGQVEVGFVYVDGSSVGEITDADLKDRRVLGDEGFISIITVINRATGKVVSGPEIHARGVAEDDSVFDDIIPKINTALEEAVLNRTDHTTHQLQQVVRRMVGTWVNRKLRRKPDDYPGGPGGLSARPRGSGGQANTVPGKPGNPRNPGPGWSTVAHMATRTSPAPKRTSSGKSGTSAGRGRFRGVQIRPGAERPAGTARTRQLAAVETRQPWLLRVVGGAWLGIGHLVGGGVRRIGHDVSDLAPEDRRDGAALFNLALAVFIATFAWWGLRGWFPDAVYAVVNGTFGWMSLVLPLMLLVCAFRLFRQPADGRGNNRVGIGFLIMTFAGCGLAHIIGGQPTVSEGFDGLRQAGGMLGFLAARRLLPFTAAVPVALYGLLAFVSLLIVTATPFGAIPRRLRAAYEHLMGIDLRTRRRRRPRPQLPLRKRPGSAEKEAQAAFRQGPGRRRPPRGLRR